MATASIIAIPFFISFFSLLFYGGNARPIDLILIVDGESHHEFTKAMSFSIRHATVARRGSRAVPPNSSTSMLRLHR